jgi:hypothetical protein
MPNMKKPTTPRRPAIKRSGAKLELVEGINKGPSGPMPVSPGKPPRGGKPMMPNPGMKPKPKPILDMKPNPPKQRPGKPGKITMPVVRPRKPIGMNATRKKGM